MASALNGLKTTKRAAIQYIFCPLSGLPFNTYLKQRSLSIALCLMKIPSCPAPILNKVPDLSWERVNWPTEFASYVYMRSLVEVISDLFYLVYLIWDCVNSSIFNYSQNHSLDNLIITVWS